MDSLLNCARAPKRPDELIALWAKDKKLSRQPVSMELRNRVRYRLSADAVFTWEGPQHRLLGEGVTRDISVAGAFIFTRTCPPVGATVELEIFLSSATGKGGRAVQIKTEARVIRVEHAENVGGFAAVSQDFTLLFENKGRDRFWISGTGQTEGDDKEASGRALKARSRFSERHC